MFLFRTKENAQRKYIDLIYDAVSKWPNWAPPRKIHAGDFGVVDKKTGDLIVEGNIYTHRETKEIASNHRTVQGADVDQYQIHSYEVQGLDLKADAGVTIPTGQGLVFKSRWQFSSKRGAILLMHLPLMTRVPDEFLQHALELPILKGKKLVYEVWECPGFYMYLSNRSSEHVTISLHANVPTPGAPGVTVQPSSTFSWSAEGSTGVRQYAYRDGLAFTPLFSLRTIKKSLLRRTGKPMERKYEKFRWVDADVPWKDLNEEGETEPEDVVDNGNDEDEYEDD
ncbi:hypothetical protein BJV74DRAFT_763147 [Russula compacta]|nr:hypothetical protein BJV74DRAFT_763147 [Russula compacta]